MRLRSSRFLAAIGVALLVCAGIALGGPAYAKDRAKPKAVPKGKSSAKPKAKEEPSALDASTRPPWTLRDHFTFQQGKTAVLYSVEDAEWSVQLENQDFIIDNARFQIVFADGATLDASGLGKAENDRSKFTNPIGSGTEYASVFPPKDGLLIRHGISIFSDRSFFLMKVGIGNNSDKPVEIAKIVVAGFGPGGITKLSKDTQGSVRRALWCGGCPVFKKDGSSILSILEDRAKGLALAFGVLPQGVANSSVDLAESSGNWVGDAVCVYNPPIRLEPGQKLESDAIWCSLSTPAPSGIEENFAWCASLLPHPAAADIPSAWATMGNDASQESLLALANTWKGSVKAVLVPGTWEGRPGSLEGSTPQFPKDMGKLAKQLDGAGMLPGITVDPLMAPGGNSSKTAKSSDGTTWYRLSEPDAKSQAVERMKKVAGWGYKFFVVAPSTIPDEVLKSFNMTRAQADAGAISVMAEAAGGLPVLPASACTLNADADAWLEAAAADNHMAAFGVPAAAVRMDAGNLRAVDEKLLTALALMKTPIEFVGEPKGQGVAQVMAGRSRVICPRFPVDAASNAPKLWKSTVLDGDSVRGYTLLAFPGARPWTLADANVEGEALVWRAADGQFVDAVKGSVAPENAMAYYGITPKPAHPVLLGASCGTDLLLSDLKSLAWDEPKCTLSGAFAGRNTDRATAYVYVPEGWAVESAHAGEASTAKKGAAGLVQFGVAPGVPTRFEFKFSKK